MKTKAMAMAMVLAGIMMFTVLPASAATLTTGDGVLSIETPSDLWTEVTDPNHWFVITDGKNTITIEHLSNGESLPAAEVANDTYAAVYQAFVSTRNEVFVVKGEAATAEELKTLMAAIGSVQVLKFDTKTAVPKETESAKAAEFGINPINATYYVVTDELNVRNGCSTDEAVIGTLYYGEAVTVNGAVTRGGADFGWFQIQLNGGTAYVSSSFLSPTEPASGSATAVTNNTANAENTEYVQCEYCGQWFAAGNDYRNHVMAAHTAADSGSAANSELVQCEYCGQWFEAGNDYRNHVMAAHSGTDSGSAANSELVQCEYCGEWFEAGNDYRNHVMAAHSGTDSGSAANSELVQCEYCGEWFEAGNDYRNHVMAAHGQ